MSMDVVIQLLKEAVDKSFAEHPDKIILLDGFPREIEQATKFEEKVGCPNDGKYRDGKSWGSVANFEWHNF